MINRDTDSALLNSSQLDELQRRELEKQEKVLNAILDAVGKAVVDCGEPAWCGHLDEALKKLANDLRLVFRQRV